MTAKGEVKLSLATLADTKELFRLRVDSFRSTYSSSLSPELLNAFISAYSPTELGIAIKDEQVTVSECGGCIAGYLWIAQNRGKEIVVSDRFYGKWIGRKLLVEGVRILLDSNDGDIEISAVPKTVNFYRRFGFETVRNITVRQNGTGIEIPLVRMKLTQVRGRKLISKDQ